MCGETRTFHLCFGEGLSYNIQSAEDGLVQVSIQKLQVIFACAESSRSSRLNWQSCGFLPFPYSQQGYMNFNSWWAAYNSSSLGANMTGDPGLPYEKQTGHLHKVSQWMSLSFPSSSSVQCLISRLLSSTDLSFTSLNLEVIMKTNIKKRKLNPEMKKLEVSNTPQSILPSLCQYSPVYWYSLLINTGSLRFSPPPMVKAHQINTRQEEFPGRVRN